MNNQANQKERPDIHEFELPMAGVPWQAPRVGRRGGKSPLAYDAFKKEVAWRAKRIYRGPCYNRTMIVVSYTFYLPRPQNTPYDVPCGPHDPDLDNLVKGLSDALQGVCWHSDKWIVRHFNNTKIFHDPGIKPKIIVQFAPVILTVEQFERQEGGENYGVGKING